MEDFFQCEQDSRDFVTWPLMHQRMAFYAGVYVPKVGFTLSPAEVSEYKALIQEGIDYEQKRIWTARSDIYFKLNCTLLYFLFNFRTASGTVFSDHRTCLARKAGDKALEIVWSSFPCLDR